jgi:hypothetical protein
MAQPYATWRATLEETVAVSTAARSCGTTRLQREVTHGIHVRHGRCHGEARPKTLGVCAQPPWPLASQHSAKIVVTLHKCTVAQ